MTCVQCCRGVRRLELLIQGSRRARKRKSRDGWRELRQGVRGKKKRDREEEVKFLTVEAFKGGKDRGRKWAVGKRDYI